MGEVDADAEIVVRLNSLGERAIGVDYKGQLLVVPLQPESREALNVILGCDGSLSGEDIAAKLLCQAGTDLVLNVTRADRSLKRPDVACNGEVVAKQRDIGAPGRLDLKRMRTRAGGTTKVFEDNNGYLAPGRGLEHRKIAKAALRACAEELGGQEQRRKKESYRCQ